jgi:hypothetical protein
LGDSEQQSVVDYLYDFAKMHDLERKVAVLEWIRYATAYQSKFTGTIDAREKICCYLLPGTSQHWICRHALSTLIGFGKNVWTKLSKLSRNNLLPSHGLQGRVGNKANPHYDSLLSEFFDKMLELTAPRAT